MHQFEREGDKNTPPSLRIPPRAKDNSKTPTKERVRDKLLTNAKKSVIEAGMKEDDRFRMDGATDEESKREIDNYFERVAAGEKRDPPLRETSGRSKNGAETIEEKAAAMNAMMMANGSAEAMLHSVQERVGRSKEPPILEVKQELPKRTKVKKEPQSQPPQTQEGSRKSLRAAGMDPELEGEEGAGWHIGQHLAYREERVRSNTAPVDQARKTTQRYIGQLEQLTGVSKGEEEEGYPWEAKTAVAGQDARFAAQQAAFATKRQVWLSMSDQTDVHQEEHLQTEEEANTTKPRTQADDVRTALMANDESRTREEEGPTLATRHSVWLDTGSPKHVFRDTDLVHSKKEIAPVTLGGIDAAGDGITAVQSGDFVTVQGVLCCPESTANILSFALLRSQGHAIAYNPERDCFGVKLKSTIKTIVFRRYVVDGVQRRHYGSMCKRREEDAALPITSEPSTYGASATRSERAAAKRAANLTVATQMRQYTRDEVRRAFAARQQQAILGYVSPASHLVTVKAGDIRNNPVKAEDIARAVDIWGKLPAIMRGRARYTKAVAAHISKLPVFTQQQQELQIDIFWWDKLIFLFGILVPMRMPFTRQLPDRSADSIEVALTSFISSCQENNVDVTTIRSDNEGGVEALKQPLQALGVHLELAGPGKHAPAAENGIRTIKSIARATKFSVNWPMPRIAVAASIAFATIAMSLSRSQLDPHIPPPVTQFSGMQLDYALHQQTKFGSMAYAEVAETNNTSDPRSTPVIVLYPILCATKKVAVWDLESDTLLERSGKITVVPTTAECIRFITAKHAREVRAGKISPPTLDESSAEPFDDGTPVDGTAPARVEVPEGGGMPYSPIARDDGAEVQPRRVRFPMFDGDALGRTRSSTAALRAANARDIEGAEDEHYTPGLRVQGEPRVQGELRVQDAEADAAAAPTPPPLSPPGDRYAHGPGVDSPAYWTGPTTRSPVQMMGGGYINVDHAEQVVPIRLANDFALAHELSSKLNADRAPPLPTKTKPGKPKPSQPGPRAATELAKQSRDRRSQDTVMVMSIKEGVAAFGELALKAISGELEQLVAKKVWRPVQWRALTATERKRVLPSSMFLKEKKDSAGKVEKIKARLVAGGHRQDKSLYSDLSSPTVSTTSVFAVSAIAAKEKRLCEVGDIPGAYLNANLEAVVHMALDRIMSDELCKLDPSYAQYRDERGRIAVQLLKALYGCVESAKLWYDDLSATLCSRKLGYYVNPEDPCVFNRGEGEGQCTILLHVDDLMVSCRDQGPIDALWKALEERYESKLVIRKGPVLSYLGMSLDFSVAGEVAVTQRGFTDEMLGECGIDLTKSAATPASDNLFVTREDADKITEAEEVWFHRLTAQMLYLAKRTRPEALTAVAFLVTRVTKCDRDDVNKLKRLLVYVNGTKERGIVLRPGSLGLQIRIFVDAAYGVHSDGRSATGSVISLGDAGPIHVKSCKQKIVTKSSTEAELVATSDSCNTPFQVRRFMIAQGHDCGPVVLYQDNLSCMHLLAKGKASSEKSRHIAIRYFWIKERVDEKEIRIEHLPTELMPANILTKPLQGEQFRKERFMLTNWPM